MRSCTSAPTIKQEQMLANKPHKGVDALQQSAQQRVVQWQPAGWRGVGQESHNHHLIRKMVKVWTSPISSKFARWLPNLIPSVPLLGTVEADHGRR